MPLLPADYLAATEAAAFYPIPHPGTIMISGETRRDYIQRQSTNDLDLLTPIRALPNLLTGPTGRILEFFILLDQGDSIAMLTQPGHGPGLAAYFQRHIFFNDKVTIQDQGSDYLQFEIHGPRAPEVLTQLGFATLPDLNGVVRFQVEGASIHVIGQPGLGHSNRFRVVAPATLANYLTTELSHYPELTFETREILRIESLHASDPEFAAEATPFELGMERLVSTTKGCYTGQEVLARQVTYDKVVRNLVKISSPVQLSMGMPLLVDEKAIGKVTSSALSPKEGPIALGLVRKQYDEPGTEVMALVDNETIIATVSTRLA